MPALEKIFLPGRNLYALGGCAPTALKGDAQCPGPWLSQGEEKPDECPGVSMMLWSFSLGMMLV